ncbi:MAG: hypothetical protein P4K86_08270 [Terracidiphilus sp.]|nr:hypothetical protein [Terracidiphilus sp.]MDR3776531.1 hypothetical protein [Terracidiphilus sp.]
MRKALGLRSVDRTEDRKGPPSMVFQLERSEWENTITLRRLNEGSRNMECQLVYAIVPMEGKFEDQGLVYVKRIVRALNEGWLLIVGKLLIAELIGKTRIAETADEARMNLVIRISILESLFA